MSSASASASASNTTGVMGPAWQQRLQGLCRANTLQDPVYNIISDRRGGRTAWSSTVTIPGANLPGHQTTLQARFWYDGAYIENAREDAAEVAFLALTGAGYGSSSTLPGTVTTTASSNGGSSYGVTSGIN